MDAKTILGRNRRLTASRALRKTRLLHRAWEHSVEVKASLHGCGSHAYWQHGSRGKHPLRNLLSAYTYTTYYWDTWTASGDIPSLYLFEWQCQWLHHCVRRALLYQTKEETSSLYTLGKPSSRTPRYQPSCIAAPPGAGIQRYKTSGHRIIKC